MASLSNSTNISFRIDKDLKRQADELFKKLGLNTSVALNMFLTQSVREQAIPFMITSEVPNTRLLKALEEARDISTHKVSAKRYDSFKEALVDLDND